MKTEKDNQEPVGSGAVLDREVIYVSIRRDGLRNSVEEANGPALPEDMLARSEILKVLTNHGYEVLGTGEGKCADSWIRLKPKSSDDEAIQANNKLLEKRKSLGVSV